MNLKKIFPFLIFILAISGALVTYKSSKAAASLISGSCGMLFNVSHWGIPIKYGSKDNSSNNLLLLFNFDTGKITGYSTQVTFGTTLSDTPTYSTGFSDGDTFDISGLADGFIKLTPRDLNKLPEIIFLPVNGGNTFLVIAADNPGTVRTPRPGSGANGVCQKI